MEQLERVIVWRGEDQLSIEYCNLLRVEDGWRLDGTVVLVLAGRPTRVRYDIRCDENWNTREIRIKQRYGAEPSELRLRVDDAQRWWEDGSEMAELRGCRDIDLAITPATNTLPIRRCQLAIGAHVEIVAAMVRFPDLSLQPSNQRYTRLDANHYRYEGLDTDFASELELDDVGLVTRYGQGWERVSEA